MPEHDDIQQKIEARLAELPEDVRNAINDNDLDAKVRSIGQKFNLHIDQIGGLGDEVMLVMLGFTPLEGFAGALATQLSLDPVLAQTITAEVNTSIFLSIRESMKKFTEERAAVEPTPDAMPPAVVATPPTPAVVGLTTQVIAKPTAPPPLSPDMHEAEKLLSTSTVQVPASPTTSQGAVPAPPVIPTAAVDPAKPQLYKADPYREPVE